MSEAAESEEGDWCQGLDAEVQVVMAVSADKPLLVSAGGGVPCRW